MKKNQEVTICNRCNGTGNVAVELRSSGHEWETHYHQCLNCGGSGRVVVTTITLIAPFVPLPPTEEKNKDEQIAA
jgi:DnaJ-class molecular chaperone